MKKILINLYSIKINPEAGNTETRIPLPKEITFYCDKIPEYLINGENCIITQCSITNDVFCDYRGILLDHELTDKLVREPNFNITIEQRFDSFSHLPSPKYFYKYRKQKIKCNECGAVMLHNELLELDNDEDSFGYAYTDKGCPECMAWDCCDIEYEEINDALMRAGEKLKIKLDAV